MNASTLRSQEYQSQLKKAWSHFINNRDFDYSCVRPEILESWKRSKQSGVNPVEINYSNLSSSQLNLKINKNIDIIDIVHPYLERLYEMVKGSGSYILLCDREGYIIDFKGDADIIAKGGTTKLGPGAMRDEKSVGTNAIGTALFLKQPIQIWGEEHYAEKHKGYTCSGAPFLMLTEAYADV